MSFAKNLYEIQWILEEEKEKRSVISKKYHRVVQIVDAVDVGLISTTMGLGISGVGLLSTIVAAPVVIVMESVALSTGVLSIIGKYVTKQCAAKAE